LAVAGRNVRGRQTRVCLTRVFGRRPTDGTAGNARRLLAAVLLCSGSMSSTNRPASRHEVFLGRSLAVCVHPHAGWRLAARGYRVVIVGGYFALGFVVVLAALALLA
jgi:hypothetical protein